MENNENKRTKTMSKQAKVILVCAIILVIIAAVFAALKFLNAPDRKIGYKTITVEVIGPDGTSQEFVIETDEEFLRGALEKENLISGDESEFGLFVKTVNGITANDANQEWWCFTKNGEMLMTGVDETPIADGDHFEITLTVGY